jgi:hypothetical protein
LDETIAFNVEVFWGNAVEVTAEESDCIGGTIVIQSTGIFSAEDVAVFNVVCQ